MKKMMLVLLCLLLLCSSASADMPADAEELFNIGMSYYDGSTVAQDYERAVEYFLLAAQQGHAGALNQLGICYYRGRGVEKDEGKALEYYTLAADKGLDSAQYNLASLYANYYRDFFDQELAIKYYRLAAGQGHIEAQYDLAEFLMYTDGRDLEEDRRESVKWYALAAEQGHVEAQYSLGYLYYVGIDNVIEQNHNEAIRWFTLAAEHDHWQAKKYLQNQVFITSNPKDQYVVEGQRASFTVEAFSNGEGELIYQWYIDRNDGNGWKAIDGAQDNNYTTSVVDLACDGFRYRCRVSRGNNYYYNSLSAVLHVSKASVIPETGDSATPLLWLVMSMLGALGFWLMRKKEFIR